MNNENVTGVNFNQFSEPVAELDLDDCKVDHCEEDHQHLSFCSVQLISLSQNIQPTKLQSIQCFNATIQVQEVRRR